MLMVIFGAGASYDSSSTYPPSVTGESPESAQLNDYHRLPLAKGLFANRPLFVQAIDEFPQCKSVLFRLTDPAVISGKVSIETRLREIEEEAKTYEQRRQELAAIRCYLAQPSAEEAMAPRAWLRRLRRNCRFSAARNRAREARSIIRPPAPFPGRPCATW